MVESLITHSVGSVPIHSVSTVDREDEVGVHSGYKGEAEVFSGCSCSVRVDSAGDALVPIYEYIHNKLGLST